MSDSLPPIRYLLSALSAASAASVDLAQIARDGVDDLSDGEAVAASLTSTETAENLADALQCALTVEIDGLEDGERKEGLGQLLAATMRFLEGWA